jgi:hypothetical protein
MLRELFSRWPEARYLAEIAASIEVARTDVDPEAGAA